MPPWRLPPPPNNLPTRASPLPSDPTDNDKANALAVVALHVRQQSSVLLRRPLLMQPVLNFRSTLVGLCRDCATSPACSACTFG
jgi:hypothetical protein